MILFRIFTIFQYKSRIYDESKNRPQYVIAKTINIDNNKFRNIIFRKAELIQAQFFKTSLKGIDLSCSIIEGIAITIEDIKGAIIDQLQAIDLLYLIGVKVK